MKYTFQHYLDISTSATSLNLIQIAAGGKYVLQRCKHLFNAYKYFKLGKISVKLIPASTLPVDPLGLSYEAGEVPTVDPRDQMNPGLVRITNGEDLLKDFSSLSDTELQQMYTNTMLDPRWSKFMLQSGFKRTAYPLFWDVAQEHQNNFIQGSDIVPITKIATPEEVQAGADEFQVVGQSKVRYFRNNQTGAIIGTSGSPILNDMSDGSVVQTGHRVKMGWLPTDSLEVYPFYSNSSTSYLNKTVPLMARIPRSEVISVLLPKAFRTIYYYRLFITETVYFSGIKNVGIIGDINTEQEFRAIDNFTHCPAPVPVKPGAPVLDRVNGYPFEQHERVT